MSTSQVFDVGSQSGYSTQCLDTYIYSSSDSITLYYDSVNSYYIIITLSSLSFSTCIYSTTYQYGSFSDLVTPIGKILNELNDIYIAGSTIIYSGFTYQAYMNSFDFSQTCLMGGSSLGLNQNIQSVGNTFTSISNFNSLFTMGWSNGTPYIFDPIADSSYSSPLSSSTYCLSPTNYNSC